MVVELGAGQIGVSEWLQKEILLTSDVGSFFEARFFLFFLGRFKGREKRHITSCEVPLKGHNQIQMSL